jgi:hypothetical protein
MSAFVVRVGTWRGKRGEDDDESEGSGREKWRYAK